ncbi:hypothetical protein BsWGS_23605 [Bradybaena similaris]
MDDKATLSLYLVMCLATPVALASETKKSLSFPGTVFQGPPSSEAEFYNTYLKFLNSRNYPAYPTIACVCIILGLVGNACFLFFFGQVTPGMDWSRDALYLRRMAAADILICAVVIPYSVLFEAKMVDSTIMCKTLEYTRNVLTLISHLLLVSYCQEFAEKDDYAQAEKRVKKSTWIIIVSACLLSCPVLFIFEVGPTTEFTDLLDRNPQANMTIDNATLWRVEGSDRYSYFRPNFCHMLLNYDSTAKYYEAVKILEVFYTMSFGFVVFVSIIMVVSSIVQFLDENPLIGRESMFVNFIETENPELTQKLERLSVRERRMSQDRERARTYLFETLELSDINKTGATTNAADQIRSMQSRSRSSSVDKKVQGAPSDESVQQLAPPVKLETKRGETVQGIQVDPHSHKNGKRAARFGRSRKSSSYYGLVLRINKERRSSRRRRRRLSDESDRDVSLVKYICHYECFRCRGKRILRVQESYAKALACLIVLDVLIAVATIILYLVADQRSVALNLIHVKSVFSFYLISFFHSDLRRATWRSRRRL